MGSGPSLPPAARFLDPEDGLSEAEGQLTLLVVGDTQGTLRVESGVLRRERNDAERAAIITALGHEANATQRAVLLHLGDAVTWGSSAEDWAEFDALFRPVREAKAAGLLVMGNHDYFGLHSQNGLALASARFPHLAQLTWWSRRLRIGSGVGSLGLVGLDSNESRLGPELWRQQQTWLEGTLRSLESDRDVRAVVVCWHHPAFTNSTLTGDEQHVQQTFLPAVLACSKAILVLSGHVHAFERFDKQGRAFVVSGGGGGPRPKLLIEPHTRHHDLFPGSRSSTRPFHFLRVRVGPDALDVQVVGLDKGHPSTQVYDTFRLPFPPQSDPNESKGF